MDLDKINVGYKVRLLDCEFDRGWVQDCRAPPGTGPSLKGQDFQRVPLGKAIIGHKVGETVTVETRQEAGLHDSGDPAFRPGIENSHAPDVGEIGSEGCCRQRKR